VRIGTYEIAGKYLPVLPTPALACACVCSIISAPKVFIFIFGVLFVNLPVPGAALSKAWVCGRSLAGIVGSTPTGGIDVFLL
jgi:hypothetical protein